MDPKVNMPKLEVANIVHLKIALQANATILGASEHITSNPATPNEESQRERHNQKKNVLLALIISSVPSEILSQLPKTSDTTPFSLLTAIENYLKMSTPNDHKNLRIEAETSTFTPEFSLD